MTTAQLEERLAKLEKEVAELTSFVHPNCEVGRDEWMKTIGRFEDSTGWDRAIALGREFREQGHS